MMRSSNELLNPATLGDFKKVIFFDKTLQKKFLTLDFFDPKIFSNVSLTINIALGSVTELSKASDLNGSLSGWSIQARTK